MCGKGPSPAGTYLQILKNYYSPDAVTRAESRIVSAKNSYISTSAKGSTSHCSHILKANEKKTDQENVVYHPASFTSS